MGRFYFLRRIPILLPVLGLLTFPITGFATESKIYYADDTPLFSVQFFDARDRGTLEGLKNNIWTDRSRGIEGLTYAYDQPMRRAINGAFSEWRELLSKQPRLMNQPASFLVGTGSAKDPAVTQVVVRRGNEIYSSQLYHDIFTASRIAAAPDLYKGPDGKLTAYSAIAIGAHLGAASEEAPHGWIYETPSQQMRHATGVSLQPILFHEIAHSLGLRATVGWRSMEDHTPAFFELARNSNTFEAHLYDQRGVKAAPGMEFRWRLSKGKKGEKERADKSFFLVERLQNTELTPDSPRGRLYFQGKQVQEVLDGRQFQGMPGIPINGWEGTHPELSHIDLPRSLMSHQGYRSYTTLLEVEMAMMQDMGYLIDRHNFYGKSIYRDGLGTVEAPYRNTQGYFGRTREGSDYMIGTVNTATLGMGLHIFGSHNRIHQALYAPNTRISDLRADGQGAVGIRVDGIDNQVTVDNGVQITADGENGRGILVAYGRDHLVTVKGEISAQGYGGDAIRFDFGNNPLGVGTEYRGSYLRYRKDIRRKDGVMQGGTNIPLDKNLDTDSLNPGDLSAPLGRLVIEGGTIAGSSHAIYLSENAFVDEIELRHGTYILGDIVSDWRHQNPALFGTPQETGTRAETLKLQYKGQHIPYNDWTRTPELRTKLRIKGYVTIEGDIIGEDNIDLYVEEGSLTCTGNIRVHSVELNKGTEIKTIIE